MLNRSQMHKTLVTTLILLTGLFCGPGCDEDPPTWEPSGVHYSQCLEGQPEVAQAPSGAKSQPM